MSIHLLKPLLLLLLKIFKEGDPSATAALQGALHLTTNIYNVKSNAKSKK